MENVSGFELNMLCKYSSHFVINIFTIELKHKNFMPKVKIENYKFSLK